MLWLLPHVLHHLVGVGPSSVSTIGVMSPASGSPVSGGHVPPNIAMAPAPPSMLTSVTPVTSSRGLSLNATPPGALTVGPSHCSIQGVPGSLQRHGTAPCSSGALIGLASPVSGKGENCCNFVNS